MKKLLFFLLLLPCLVKAQVTYYTPAAPPSSTSFSPTFRFLGTDSLANFYINNSNRWSLLYTAAQSNLQFLRNQTHQSQPFNYWMTGTGEIDNTSGVSVLSFLNKTAATNILNPTSPYQHWGAFGWGASSQAVDFYAGVVTSAGTSAPTGAWTLFGQINGGTVANIFQVSNSGNATFNGFNVQNGTITGKNDASGGLAHALFSNGILYQAADNDVLANVDLNATFVANSGLATVVIDNPGSGGANTTYHNVPVIDLTGGNHTTAGTALADVTVSGGAVTVFTPTTFGARYAVSSNLTVLPANIGGVTGFAAHVATLHTYTVGKLLDLRVANGVQFNGLSSITAVNGLGIDASGNVGAVMLPTTISASNGVVDSLGVIQLSTGTSNYLNKVTKLKDANGTVNLWIQPSNTAPFFAMTATNSGAGISSGLFISTNSGSSGITFSNSSGTDDIAIGSNGVFMDDPIFQIGAQYQVDYSTNSRLQRLSIPSVGTTIGLIDSVKATITGLPTPHPLTMNNSGSGASSGSTFDGSSAKTISYNTIGAQAALGFTPENVANKATTFGTLNNTLYPSTQAVANYVTSFGYGTGTVTSVTGTTNRITSTGGTTPVIDISATFEALLGKVANPLSQFASTTSAQLATVLSDESGTGVVAYTTNPAFTTPNLGTPSAINLTNATGAPTWNQNTTGTAAAWTTARNLAGNSVDGSANVAFANKFIVQGTTDAGLSNAQFLGALGTGIVKNTTTTGVLSIAVAADFPTLNQNTSGTASNLSGTPALPNGTTATTQTGTDATTKLATDAFVANNFLQTSLSGNKNVVLNLHALNIGTGNNNISIDDGLNQVGFIAGNGTTETGNALGPTDANISYSVNATSKTEEIDVTSTGVLFTSQVALAGPKLAGQYNANLTSLSLMPKSATDSLYALKTTGLTAIGITTANGVSGTSSGGTTPNLTISLGAITPTSIGSATTATTQSAGDNSTKIATTAYVNSYAPLSGNLSQFASTTSAQLRAVLSDESGTGAAIFAGGALGAATATSINGITITSSTGTLTVGTGTLALANGISFTVDGIGQTTLVAGTKAVSITGVTTSSRAFVTLVAQGGTSTTVYDYKAVCSAGTVTISAESVAGALVSTDTSILNYLVVN